MPAAEIIAIGTELLLGEIQDTNTQFLARTLRDAGVDLFRTTIIGDNVERIAQAIQESLARCQIIITSGGLGPTIDDPTRQAIARAIGVEQEFRSELWEQIVNRFQRFSRVPTENNRRQAYIPAGAIAVENPVGTAPAFIVEIEGKSVISLPGVPRELEYLTINALMPYLRTRFGLMGTIKACVIHCTGVGESQVDEWVADLETLANPTVGLAAHPGEIDIRVTAKANSQAEADLLIENLVAVIFERVGENAYGKNEDTLESVIARRLEIKGWTLGLIEAGPGLNAAARLNKFGTLNLHLEKVEQPYSQASLIKRMKAMVISGITPVILGYSFQPGEFKQTLLLSVVTPEKTSQASRTYGGPAGNGPQWAENTALDYLRRQLLKV